jgi:TonB family protein
MKHPLILCVLLILVASFSLHSQTGVPSVNDQPTATAAVAPNYPPIARSAHISGNVDVQVKLNSRGDVEDTKVLSGHPLLQASCKEAANKWKFVTTTEKQSRIVQLTFSFVRVESGKSAQKITTTFLPPYKVEVLWNSTGY